MGRVHNSGENICRRGEFGRISGIRGIRGNRKWGGRHGIKRGRSYALNLGEIVRRSVRIFVLYVLNIREI